MNVKIAVAQTDSVIGDVPKNITHHIAMIKKAIQKKADIVVFPELSLTGYSVKDLNWDIALRAAPQKIFSELQKLSHHITILAGAVEEADNFGIYNSAFLFEDGKVHSVHKKNYPPTYGMFEEMRYFSQGKEVRCFQSKHGKIGVLVCEDLWHLSLPYILAHDGAEIIIGIAASPTRISGTQDELSTAIVNHEQHRVFARLLSSYVVWSNRVGIEDGVNFWGGSHIVDPSGNTIAKGKYFEEDLIVAEIKENEVRRARRFSRHFVDDAVELTIDQLHSSLQRRKS
jgi:predicted amidohydrolase